MNLIRAMKSGKYFRRPQQPTWFMPDHPNHIVLNREDVLARDWIIGDALFGPDGKPMGWLGGVIPKKPWWKLWK